MIEKRQQRPKYFFRKRVCVFCTNKTEPDYKDVSVLRRLLSDRGRIINRGKTGTCAKHQRTASTEIKRARHLALLPFVAKI